MSLAWEASEGADGVHYAHQGRYTARIVEGRVWRWQVGDDREPARLSGRTTRGAGEVQEACALAVRLLELSDAGADVEGLPTVADGKDPDRQERERKMPADQIGERMREAMHLYGAETAQEFAARAMDLWHEFHDAWNLGRRDGYAAGSDEAEARVFADSLVVQAQQSADEAWREAAKCEAREREDREQIADLRDQIGERDGVIAQLRASLDALQARYDERGAKVLEVIADNDALRGDATQIKVGDRVLWRSYNGDLVGTVTRMFGTPDGLACEVVGERGGCVALAWALEVVK